MHTVHLQDLPSISPTQWADFFNLTPRAKERYTLGQIMAKGVDAVCNRYGFEEDKKEITLNVLSWLIRRIQGNKDELIAIMDTQIQRPEIQQQHMDLLQGVANCLVDPHYCAHTKNAPADNAKEWIWVFENLYNAVEDETICGKEGDENRRPGSTDKQQVQETEDETKGSETAPSQKKWYQKLDFF